MPEFPTAVDVRSATPTKQPSARESSTSATARRASQLVCRALLGLIVGGTSEPVRTVSR